MEQNGIKVMGEWKGFPWVLDYVTMTYDGDVLLVERYCYKTYQDIVDDLVFHEFKMDEMHRLAIYYWQDYDLN